MKYIVANWKANKTLADSIFWIDKFLSLLEQDRSVKQKLDRNITVVICPPYPHLYSLKEKLKGSQGITLGAQDVSSIEKGTYTGETTALNLQGIVDFAIIGHSERRKKYNETDQDFFAKHYQAHKNNIKSLYCIGKESDPFPSSVDFICWEPPESISTGDGRGNFKPLQELLDFKHKLNTAAPFIYGGSVNEANITTYTTSPEISGLIIGGASLDPTRFSALLARI